MSPRDVPSTRPTTSRRARAAGTLLLATTLALGACTSSPQDPAPDETGPPPPPPVAQAADVEGTVVLGDADAARLALAASRTFFAAAPLVVLVPDDAGSPPGADLAPLLEAAATGVDGPVLVRSAAALAGGPEDETDTEVAAELERLGAVGALVLGPPDGAGAADPEQPGAGDAAGEDGSPAASSSVLADLTTVHLDPADHQEAVEARDADALAAAVDAVVADLPETGTAELSIGTLALTATPPADEDGVPAVAGAAAATARAAGADVLDAPGGDPRATSATVEAIHEAQPRAVVGLGPQFGDDDELAWRVTAAATGVELPGGGQLALPGKRYVALYGSPVTEALGVLGEQGVDATIARAQEHASRYDDLTDEPVIPTLEIIVTVASGSAGDDGNYSNEWPVETFRPLIDAAHDAGQYVVLDFQPGRTDFLTQIREYEELLALPNVGVALDPEWRLKPDQVHLRQIGSVGIDEVNDVVDYLADFTRERDLPQKILVLHQFRLSMITERERLDTSRDEVAVVIHADGQGGQGAKQDTWRALHQDAPDGVFWGWKNFYDEDQPMLTPEQTFQVRPVPEFVSYQ